MPNKSRHTCRCHKQSIEVAGVLAYILHELLTELVPAQGGRTVARARHGPSLATPLSLAVILDSIVAYFSRHAWNCAEHDAATRPCP